MADSQLEQLSKMDRNPIEEEQYQQLLKQNEIAFNPVKGADGRERASVAGFGIGGNGSDVMAFANAAAGAMPEQGKSPTINLPQLYEGMYAKSGIKDSEADITNRTNMYNEQISKIKDNPYLSEATMTGRIKKLDDKHQADIANIKNDIIMKKADIETQLNLQTKQFDINSQAAQNELNKFQSLLSAGAYDNASAIDIARLTRATGLSSSMIKAAVDANIKKNTPQAKAPDTQLLSFDDGTNAGYALINSQTGEVIKTQTIAGSKPSAAEEKAALKGTGGGSGGGTVSSTKQIAADKAAAPSSATQDAKNKMTLGTMMSLYQQYGMTPQQIYNIYKVNTSYKQTDATKAADRKRYGVK